METVSVPKQGISVEMRTENVMSVNVPRMEFKKENIVPGDVGGGVYPYGYAQTTSRLTEPSMGRRQGYGTIAGTCSGRKSCSINGG